MNFNLSLNLISYCFSFALLLQCCEMILISQKSSFLKIWSFQNLKSSLIFKKFFERVYSKKGYQFLLSVQLILILALFAKPAHPLLVLAIAFIHLLICLRFRGLFNGGSDMMVFVIATGLIIGNKFGLFYIAIHTSYSYFKAGIVKVIQPSWRSGLAISQFFGTSLYSSFQRFEKHLQNQKPLGLILSYSVLAFELLIPLLFIFPKSAPIFFVLAIVFHIVNSIVFGLNRFFWIWLAAWPAILYCTKIIKF